MCAQGSDVMYAAEDDDEQSRTIMINHPSHPEHELKFLRRSCPFKCDACGTIRRGKSYLCVASCQYWIHERCASLPQTIKREDHRHPLYLAFHLPSRYIKYNYKCDVCSTYLVPQHWTYHCELCSYVVHLECAFKKSPRATRRKNDDEKWIMEFPISDVGEELIGDFVKRQGGATPIPLHDVDYKFHNHKLRLVSLSQEEKEEEENSDDDDGKEDYSKKSELICDGCSTPIFRKHRSSSSSSSDKFYYMSCSIGCNFNLHMACFHLPPQLPSIPLHHQPGHDIILKSSDKLPSYDWSSDDWYCTVCYLHSNGLFYTCTKCTYFKVDIKCASMPDTIYHAAHPQHPLTLLLGDDPRNNFFRYICDAGCGSIISGYDNYACGSCDFMVDLGCAGPPASTTIHEWDKHHPQPLTYDATLNHPDDFYCDQCETEMNPKSWKYHCRSCDLSFHPKCLKTTTGKYRNIKFGQKYVIAGAHRHTLTYQLLTTKRHCDLCGEDRYELPGFHCASCNFFICFSSCGREMLQDGNIQAVD